MALCCSNGAQAPLRHSLGRHETKLQLLASRLSGLNDRAVDEMMLRAGGAKFVTQVHQYYADEWTNTVELVDKQRHDRGKAREMARGMTEERLATMSAEEREHGMELVEEVARMGRDIETKLDLISEAKGMSQETLLHAIHVFHVRRR